MNVLWSDVRLAVRGLMKAPGFSLAAIGALALGIGPNTAIFSVVHATLLAPLPFPEPDQLVNVWSRTPSAARSVVSPGDPFRATTGGKRQQTTAQSEARKSLDSTGDDARSGGVRHTAAKNG